MAKIDLNDVIKHPKKYIKKAIVKETLECEHKRLDQLLNKTAWYKCHKCKMIFYITGHLAWYKDNFKELIKALKKKV